MDLVASWTLSQMVKVVLEILQVKEVIKIPQVKVVLKIKMVLWDLEVQMIQVQTWAVIQAVLQVVQQDQRTSLKIHNNKNGNHNLLKLKKGFQNHRRLTNRNQCRNQ